MIEPGAVVESEALHDQRVSIPTPDRVPHPRRIGGGFQCAAVEEDLAIREIGIENDDEPGSLDDLHHLRPGAVSGGGVAGPQGHALHVHVVPAEIFPALLDQRLRPRLNFFGLQVRRDVARILRRDLVPQAREIGLAVGRARRGRGQIRLAVGCARNSRRGVVQPLSRERCPTRAAGRRRREPRAWRRSSWPRHPGDGLRGTTPTSGLASRDEADYSGAGGICAKSRPDPRISSQTIISVATNGSAAGIRSWRPGRAFDLACSVTHMTHRTCVKIRCAVLVVLNVTLPSLTYITSFCRPLGGAVVRVACLYGESPDRVERHFCAGIARKIDPRHKIGASS